MNTININNQSVCFKHLKLSMFIIAALPFLEIGWKTARGMWANIGYVFLPFAFMTFVYNAVRYIKVGQLFKRLTIGHHRRVQLYMALLIIITFYGLIRGNEIQITISQAMFFFSLGFFLVLGADDRVCDVTFKIATVMIWLAAIFATLTFNIHSYDVDLASWEDVAGSNMRYESSLAIKFHVIFGLGLPLFLHGWLVSKSWWGRLQMLALVPFLVFDLFIFKYRGSLFMVAMVLVAALLMPVGKKRKFVLIIGSVVCFFGLCLWLHTQGGGVFSERLLEYEQKGTGIISGMFEYRWPESERFFEETGIECLWGRGIGGGFDLGGMFLSSGYDSNWQVLHIGWLTFMLKGGIPFLLIMLSFWLAGLGKKNRLWMKNIHNIIAKLWCPIIFAIWLLNPITMNYSSTFIQGLTFLLLARFGQRQRVIRIKV